MARTPSRAVDHRDGDEPLPRVLAVTDTFMTGATEHHVVSGAPGRWRRGWLRGYLATLDWGPAAGHQGCVLASDGQRVMVDVLEGDGAAVAARTLSRYLGNGFRLERTSIELDGGGTIDAVVHVLVTDGED